MNTGYFLKWHIKDKWIEYWIWKDYDYYPSHALIHPDSLQFIKLTCWNIDSISPLKLIVLDSVPKWIIAGVIVDIFLYWMDLFWSIRLMWLPQCIDSKYCYFRRTEKVIILLHSKANYISSCFWIFELVHLLFWRNFYNRLPYCQTHDTHSFGLE